MAPSNPKKKSLGRQKIEMKFIEKEGARTSTFSKRKHGIFKKATEFTAMCGAQLAVIFFSMCGRVYPFGNPSVEAVLDKVYGGSSASPHEVEYYVPDARFTQDQVKQLKCRSDKLTEDLEISKRKRLDLNEKLLSTCPEIFEDNISQFTLSKMDKLKQKLQILHDHQLRCKAGGGDLLAFDENGASISLANIEIGESEKSGWLKL